MITDPSAPDTLRPDAATEELRRLIDEYIEDGTLATKSGVRLRDAVERLASAPPAAAPLGKYGCGCPVKRSDTVDAFCAEHCRPIDRATVPCTPEVCPEMARPAAGVDPREAYMQGWQDRAGHTSAAERERLTRLFRVAILFGSQRPMWPATDLDNRAANFAAEFLAGSTR